MSNFTPLVKKTYQFEGDIVEVTFARLKRKHMLKIIPHISAMTKAQEDADQAAIADTTTTMLNIIIDALPEYVTEINGLTSKEGGNVGLEDITNEMYFMGLATDICMDILNESTVMDGPDAKNG
jgi:hypothetical protein